MILEAAALCLALNIYHEARGEAPIGQVMVGVVTLNRADWKPENVCNEVYAPRQFSWTMQPALYRVDEPRAWGIASSIAAELIQASPVTVEAQFGVLGLADHYHADYVSPPAWAHDMERVGQIGRHIFYREKR